MNTKTTTFGKLIRLARLETNDTLVTMGDALGKSSGFLSAIETGRTKIPLDIVPDIIDFFKKKDYTFDDDLMVVAIINNGTVNIEGLDADLQKLIAKLSVVSDDKNKWIEIIDDFEDNINL